MTSASVQAAVYVREKQKLRQNKRHFNRGRFDLPSHVATRDIGPFPTYPPQNWGKSPSVNLDRDKIKFAGSSLCTDIEPSLISHAGKLKLSDTRRWTKRYNTHRSSLDGSSPEKVRSGLHRQYNAAANMLLYVGLCAVALGLVIAFVGTGEKGFKTVQLRLIGPTMIGCGTFCCCLRIVFCFCPTRYMRKRFKGRRKNLTVALLSEAVQLNKRGLRAENGVTLQYCKRLPIRAHVSNDFVLFERTTPSSAVLKNVKKRVPINVCGIGKSVASSVVPYRGADDAASDTLSSLRELSPLHEEDLIDFQHSSNSLHNLPSLDSSLEYLNERLRDVVDIVKDTPTFNSEEQLKHLKSTLTFRDSNDLFTDSRLMMSYDDFDLTSVDGARHRDDEQRLFDGVQELVLNVEGKERKN